MSGRGIAWRADAAPPGANGLHRERGRVMVDADADPPGIGSEIVDAIRDGPAQLLDQKVMHADFLGLALRSPLSSCVLEVSNQLLFLRVDRNHRLLLIERARHARVDVGELSVTIRMAVALAGLAVRLQAEFLRLEQLAHHRMADPVPQHCQFAGQATQAFAGPAQRRHRVTAFAWRDQPQQVAKQRRIRCRQRLAPSARTANAMKWHVRTASKLPETTADRADRNAGGLRNRCYPAIPG